MAAGVAAAVVGGAWLLVVPQSPDAPRAAAPASVPGPGATTTPTSPAPVSARRDGPPAGTVAIASRYLKHYDATRVDWDDVLARGHALPKADKACVRSWKASGLDPRINPRRADYWCWDGLGGRAYKPQGIAGSGTTEGYRIRSRWASNRNIILTSWYSKAAEPGLFATNTKGESVTRLVVIDLDKRRYNTIELVRPDGRDRLRRLNSHGSGLAWAGQYLYSSSKSWVWLYNADDLLTIDGHFVLPAVARWSVSGSGGASSISLHRRAGQDRLTTITYTKTGPTRVHAFALDRHGLLTAGPTTANQPLVLTTGFGEKRRVIRSMGATTLDGTNFQGVGTWGRYRFANSSALRLAGPSSPRVDATVVLRSGKVLHRFRLPGGNVESVYVDPRRKTYASVTEDGSQFLFVLPLSELTSR